MAAVENWYEIYRDAFTAEEREAELVRLKEESRSAYRSQQRGDASYEKDLAVISAKLQALARLKRESGARSARQAGNWGVADFSGMG